MNKLKRLFNRIDTLPWLAQHESSSWVTIDKNTWKDFMYNYVDPAREFANEQPGYPAAIWNSDAVSADELKYVINQFVWVNGNPKLTLEEAEEISVKIFNLMTNGITR